MSRTPIPVKDGSPLFVDANSGETYTRKPEEMTHLSGNLLVPKTDVRIAFRGKLDSLQAAVIRVQEEASRAGKDELVAKLGEVLETVRAVLGAEVKGAALHAPTLFGLDSSALKERSHRVKETFGIDHPVPDYRMGALPVALNALRTQVRETELACAAAFDDHGTCTRSDLVEALNRLSSAVYLLYCGEVAQTGVEVTQQNGVTVSPAAGGGQAVLTEISARHVHLSAEDLEALFGAGYELTPVRPLSQPGQFLAKEKVSLTGPRDSFPKVSILGPVRSNTQVELSMTDARRLGINAPVNLSGNLSGAGDVTITGPVGSIDKRGCVIVAKEHVHLTPAQAAQLGVKHNDHVSVALPTERPVTLEDVVVRVSDTAGKAVHIDTDQAAAAGMKESVTGYLMENTHMNKEELSRLVETVANEMLSAKEAVSRTEDAASFAAAGERLLFLGDGTCALPEELARGMQVETLAAYEAQPDITRYQCVVIGHLSTQQLADIALGRMTDAFTCAVLHALLSGTEVLLLDCALSYKKYAGKGSVALYQTLEGYAKTLQRYGIKKFVSREVKKVELSDPPAHAADPVLIVNHGKTGRDRRLIAEAEALQMAAELKASHTQSIRLEKGTILTPSARDVFLRNRIEVIV